MLRKILSFGLIAGVIAGLPLSIMIVMRPHESGGVGGMIVGYLTMLIALTAIFIAIKRRRDIDLGGVIKFWPALALGLGISVVAGIVYVAIWDTACALSHMDFAGDYARGEIAAAQARGVSGDALAKVTTEMEQFKTQYANPLYRWPMTFIEIFPVGVLVSLISAGLLCNSRFLPARRA